MARGKIYLIISGIMLIPGLLYAQGQTKQEQKKRPSLIEGTAAGAQAPITAYGQMAPMDVLEREIDPNTYLLGPGDVISVNVWSGLEQQFSLTVSSEGTIALPTVGDIKIGGILLSQAKEKIEKATRRVYNAGEITVYLQKLRRFRVPVSGIVPYPGIYDASAADRVSHLLEAAGNLITEFIPVPVKKSIKPVARQTVPLIQPRSSLRNILLIHNRGDTTRVDFLMFSRNNDNNYNPLLQEGDAIYVPPLSEEIGTVEVSGALKIPGIVEYASGDKVRDIVNVCAGFSDDAKLDEVTAVRCEGNSAEYQSFKLDLSRPGPDWDFPLRADDRIFVRAIPEYHLRHKVTIEGEVFFPGEYSIVEKKSRLSEVIKMAGGFTTEANLADAEIVRTTEEEVADPEYERLKTIPVADMTDMEYEYFKTKSREKAFVVVDFEALFLKGDKSQDILLRDNDAINIPMQAKTVRVSGQVVNPGLLNWEQGQNYLFYVERAGGFSYNAQKSRIRVIRASTGSWLKPDKKTIINLGDTIFVPEKPERDYWEIYKDIILVVSQMATIIILIRTVSL